MEWTATDYVRWFNVVRSWPASEHQLMEWLIGPIREYFPFQRVLLIHAEQRAGAMRVTHQLACGHDEAYLRKLADRFELGERGALAHWLENQTPLGIDPATPPEFATS